MPMSQLFQERLFPKLPDIAKHFGTPFHIYDGMGIRKTIRNLQESFTKNDVSFREYYAVKALPKPAIMKIMQEENCGFDCSSIPELRLARAAGASGEDIMFTSNNTSLEEFREAMDNGGCILNLDDEIFIDKVPLPFPDLICFRLNPGDRKTGDEVNAIIGNPKESKYGVPIENIVRAYARAKEKGAKRFGLHTMVCSNDREYTHMVNTVELLLHVASDLHRELDIKLEFINMGGGIGIPYRPSDGEFDIKSLAKEIDVLLWQFKSSEGFVPKVFAESGRYITGPHGVLVNRVINVYEKYERFVGVEVAMPALMRVGMYGAYHHPYVVSPEGVLRTGKLLKQSVVGPICENCDRLSNQVEMPEAFEGDFIVTADTGAHAIAMGFTYNGRPRPQGLLMRALGAVVRVCRAETYDDLIARNITSPTPEDILP